MSLCEDLLQRLSLRFQSGWSIAAQLESATILVQSARRRVSINPAAFAVATIADLFPSSRSKAQPPRASARHKPMITPIPAALHRTPPGMLTRGEHKSSGRPAPALDEEEKAQAPAHQRHQRAVSTVATAGSASRTG